MPAEFFLLCFKGNAFYSSPELVFQKLDTPILVFHFIM